MQLGWKAQNKIGTSSTLVENINKSMKRIQLKEQLPHSLLVAIFCFMQLVSLGHSSDSTSTTENRKELERVKALLLSESKLDSMVEKVLKASYQIRLGEAMVSQSQYALKQENKNWMRSLNFGVNLFGYSITPTSQDIGSTAQVSMLSNASLTLLINPYEILSQGNRSKKAQEEVRIKELTLEDNRRQIKIYAIGKFLEYHEALESYIIYENQLMISEESKHIADEHFKQGRISNNEYNLVLQGVMKSKQDLLKAEGRVLKLKYEIELLMAQ